MSLAGQMGSVTIPKVTVTSQAGIRMPHEVLLGQLRARAPPLWSREEGQSGPGSLAPKLCTEAFASQGCPRRGQTCSLTEPPTALPHQTSAPLTPARRRAPARGSRRFQAFSWGHRTGGTGANHTQTRRKSLRPGQPRAGLQGPPRPTHPRVRAGGAAASGAGGLHTADRCPPQVLLLPPRQGTAWEGLAGCVRS